MQRKEDTVLDKADNLTSGWLIEVKAFWWDLSCPNCSFFFSSFNVLKIFKSLKALYTRNSSAMLNGEYN